MNKPYTQLILAIAGHVATITLNRPERLNALGAQLTTELQAALRDLEEHGDVRAVIITGAGPRAFCAGADLKERALMDAAARWAHNRALNDCNNQLARLQLPSIAAVGGLALGGGCELALACDLRIAADTATFGLPEVGLGIIPGAGGTQRLPRLIGPARAKELILTARRVDAATALAWGLVNAVAPADGLLDAAHELAASIAAQSPLAVAHAKASIDTGLESSLEQGLRYETAAIRATLGAEDYQIGLEAFAARETPAFPPLKGSRIV